MSSAPFETGNDPTPGATRVRRRIRLNALEGSEEAIDLLLQLPGVARAAVETGSSELVVDLDPEVLSDQELRAALQRGGVDAGGWTDEPVPSTAPDPDPGIDRSERAGGHPTELVEEASEQSFPASDPPPYRGGSTDAS